MIEFVRWCGDDVDAVEEDARPDRQVAINPTYVACVFESINPGAVVIRLADGRGVLVRGTYAEVRNRLGPANPTE